MTVYLALALRGGDPHGSTSSPSSPHPVGVSCFTWCRLAACVAHSSSSLPLQYWGTSSGHPNNTVSLYVTPDTINTPTVVWSSDELRYRIEFKADQSSSR